ncbi:MAG: hypothetical protein GF320_03555, partial [Armatimonadia bacterium]|nr:hypothetical protein [Armatimonadia bacterium]
MAALALVSLLLVSQLPAETPDRPIVGAAYFYWYEWDPSTETGSWTGQGIYNTPLYGYYSSASYEDNLRAMHLAADWGMTDLFMDFWGRGWLGEDGQPRELLLTRAAEELQSRGYNIHISMYQDGEDFDVADMASNLDSGRDVRWWLDSLAVPTDAWSQFRGRPLGLIYARNGTPEPSGDVAAFRRFLRGKYGDLASVNRAWATAMPTWAEVDLRARPGQAWADVGEFRRAEWARERAVMQERTRSETGAPGLELSFDTGYAPYPWAGIHGFVDLFGGPHSYGGLNTPEQQLAERYLYHAAARNTGRLSFDHHKGFYHDWEIRIPGIAWWAEPHRLDRHFVGLMASHATSTFHMSWNEWWEGSNLEPSREFGKAPCETNLLYSTLMRECYESLAHPETGARTAFLANEWPLRLAHPGWTETVDTLRMLRRHGAPFATITGSPLGTDLEQYDVIVAPGGGVGFEDGAVVADRLLALAESGKTIIVSSWPLMREKLAMPLDQPSAETTAEPFNAFYDIGTPAGDVCLGAGFSNAEVWSHLTSFDGEAATVRWTPAVGDTLLLHLPVAPGREQVLRWSGSALWSHTVSVQVNGSEVAQVAIEPGLHSYETPIPAQAIGYGALATVSFVYEPSLIPTEINPAAYPTEDRACNLAVDWVQVSTPDVPPATPGSAGLGEGMIVQAQSPLGGGPAQWRDPAAFRDPLADSGQVLSRYKADGVPRDVRVDVGDGTVVYVNGSIGGPDDASYVTSWLTAVSGARSGQWVRGEDCVGVALRMGDTVVVPVLNADAPTEERQVSVATIVPSREGAAARAIRRDGAEDVRLKLTAWGPGVRLDDRIETFGLYEITPGPLRLEAPTLDLVAGATRLWRIDLHNPTDRNIRATLSLRSAIPTLSADPVEVTVPLGSTVSAPLQVHAREDIDWGHKTVVLRVLTDDSDARTVRTITV